MPSQTVKVQYQCLLCGTLDREVEMPAREPHQDVIWWVQRRMMPALMRDHAERSPDCPADKFDWVKIPVAGDFKTGLIGGALKN